MSLTTTQQSGCCGNCSGATTTGVSGAGALERPRYYARQLITPDIMTLGDDYFRVRLRRHNRFLHGWGVVCGALVCVVPAKEPTVEQPNQPWVVQVQPGFAVTPTGDEVEIVANKTVSLRNGLTPSASSGDDWSDPWCTEVYTDQPSGPVYVAVRYREFRVQPVLSQPGGCGCGDHPCEYSRYQDCFEIGVLASCTDTATPSDDTGNPPCPTDPPSPWVTLAEVTLDADGTITKIDNCACRRILEPATWRRCAGTDGDYTRDQAQAEPAPAEPAPAAPAPSQPAPPAKPAARSRRSRTGST